MNKDERVFEILRAACNEFYDKLSYDELKTLRWLSEQSIDDVVNIANIINKAKLQAITIIGH